LSGSSAEYDAVQDSAIFCCVAFCVTSDVTSFGRIAFSKCVSVVFK